MTFRSIFLLRKRKISAHSFPTFKSFVRCYYQAKTQSVTTESQKKIISLTAVASGSTCFNSIPCFSFNTIYHRKYGKCPKKGFFFSSVAAFFTRATRVFNVSIGKESLPKKERKHEIRKCETGHAQNFTPLVRKMGLLLAPLIACQNEWSERVSDNIEP